MKDNELGILALGLGFFALIGYLTFIYITKTDPIIQNYYVQPSDSQNAIPPFNYESIKTEEIRPTRPHIINHYLRNANIWYEIKLPIDNRTWQLKARGNYDLFYSFEPSASTYMTLVKGSVLSENTAPNKNINAIYVMCETANVTIELELWRNNG